MQSFGFYNEAARMGARKGVVVAVDPRSHHTSLVLSATGYDRLLAATEASGLMFNPDTGHIARGGQDVVSCFRRHRERIVHFHCEDMDGMAGDGGNQWGRGSVIFHAFSNGCERPDTPAG